MLYHVYIAEPPTLLDDLLEDSARVFHHHCGIIQRVFHERWLELVAELVGKEQLETPDEKPSKVEARAHERLRGVRAALREKQKLLIQKERNSQTVRDAAIRVYVASRHTELPAAA